MHDVGTPDLPWLGRLRRPRRDHRGAAHRPRDHRLLHAPATRSCWSAIRACRDAGVAVDVVPRLFEFLDGVRALDQVGGLPLLSIGAPILTSASVAAKRVLDVIGSLALITLFSPVMIATAIAIKLESRGPVFFRQPRAGRGNASFQLIKFRSMYIDAEQRKEEYRQAQRGHRRRHVQDPRGTRASPASAASSAASRSTSCRSCSTSCAAR